MSIIQVAPPSHAPEKTSRKSKTRVWEKERRDRLNEGFSKLSQALPCYDSSKTFSKIEIIEHARLAINDLDEKLKKLVSSQESEKAGEEKLKVSAEIIKKLQDRVRKLLLRNEQLSNLLRNAGISIPTECSTVKKFTKRYKDSYKLAASKVKKELEKENQAEVVKTKKAKPFIDLKHKKNSSPNLKGKKYSKKVQVLKTVPSPSCVFIVSQPGLINNSCYIIAKSSKKGNQTVITNSLLLKTPIVSSNIKPSVFPTNPSSNFGPGTLILANGTVMPVVPTPQTLPILPTIFTNPIQNNISTLIVVSCSAKTSCINKVTVSNSVISPNKDSSKSSVGHSVYNNTRLILRPKTCLTKTTQVNKVPIPALSSRHTKHSCTGNSKVKIDDSKKICDKFNKNKRVLAQVPVEPKKSKKDAIEDKVPEECSTSAVPRNIVAGDEENKEQVATSKEADIVLKDTNEASEQINADKIKEVDNGSVVEDGSKYLQDGNKSVISTNDPVTSRTAEVSISGIEQILTESVASEARNDIALPMQDLNKTTKATVTSENIDLQLEPTVVTTVTASTELTSIFSTSTTTRCSTQVLKSLEMSLPSVTSDKKSAPDLKGMEINLPPSELSNDLFASLHVPSGCQNPESTSPTAAFLLAFPLVSSGVKVTEVIGDENAESQAGTPNLLQIGTMDATKPTQSHSESLTPSLLNLDNFSFFSNKDSCGGFYNNFSSMTATSQSSILITSSAAVVQNTYVDNISGSLMGGNQSKGNQSGKDVKNNFVMTTTENVLGRKTGNMNINKKVIKENVLNSSRHYSTIPASLNNVERNASNINSSSFENKPKTNDILQPYVPKTFENCSRYVNYKDCSSLATNNFPSNKNFNLAYTSAGSNNYFYNSYSSEGDNRNYNSSHCGNYSEYRKTDSFLPHYNDTQRYNQNVPSQNKLFNWMATPTTTAYKPDYFLPSFSKENDHNPNLHTSTSFNTYSVYTPTDHISNATETRKTVDKVAPTWGQDIEENHFSWSPNKIPQFLDPAHAFSSSTLPTLVGDLALNNISEQKIVKDRNSRRKLGNFENQSGQSNFLSVSQLVEHNRESVPAKVSSRRSSGNRSKTNTPKKRVSNKAEANKEMMYPKVDKPNHSKHFGNNNLFCDAKQQVRTNKIVPSSYSAEALIGNQVPNDSSAKKNERSIVSSFLSDNIVPYFPTVDVSQENSYMQASQSYQANSFSHNFTTFPNNNYNSNNIIPSACAIPTTYISNNNFMHNTNIQEYQGDNGNILQNINISNKDKNNYTKNYHRPDKDDKNDVSNCKKVKKRGLNEPNPLSFDIPFLPLPGAINSPILPDDFHTTYLPPTTLYSCKNPLYSKSTSELSSSTLIPPLPTVPGGKTGIQHPEISPSVNSVGTSLTNFNLSAIFPEINKGQIQETYSDIRNKDYPVPRSFPVTSSIQVPFTNKPSISFSSFGT